MLGSIMKTFGESKPGPERASLLKIAVAVHVHATKYGAIPAVKMLDALDEIDMRLNSSRCPDDFPHTSLGPDFL